MRKGAPLAVVAIFLPTDAAKACDGKRDSSAGKASVAPMPRKKFRRGSDCEFMIMGCVDVVGKRVTR